MAIVDPVDANRVTGYRTRPLGIVKIVEVRSKTATCEIVEGGEGVKKGDIVRLELSGRRGIGRETVAPGDSISEIAPAGSDGANAAAVLYWKR